VAIITFAPGDAQNPANPVDYTPSDVTANVQQNMNVYLPDPAVHPQPLAGYPYVVILHLSGYTASNKATNFQGDTDNDLGSSGILPRFGFNLLNSGIAVADCEVTESGMAINGSGLSVPPGFDLGFVTAPYLDELWAMSVKDAIYIAQHLANNAESYGLAKGSAKRLILGDSAGGETSAWVGLAPDRVNELGSSGTDAQYGETTLFAGTLMLRAPVDWPSFSQSEVTGAKFVDQTRGPTFQVPAVFLSDAFTTHQDAFSISQYATSTPVWCGYDIKPEGSLLNPPTGPFESDVLSDPHDSYSGMILKAKNPSGTRFVIYSELSGLSGAGDGESLKWFVPGSNFILDLTNQLTSAVISDMVNWTQEVLGLFGGTVTRPIPALPVDSATAEAETSIAVTLLNEWAILKDKSDRSVLGSDVFFQGGGPTTNYTVLVFPGQTKPTSDLQAFKLKQFIFSTDGGTTLFPTKGTMFIPGNPKIWVKEISGTINLPVLASRV